MLRTWVLKPLLKGVLVVVPIAATLWLLWSSFIWLNELGLKALAAVGLGELLFPGSGLLIMLALLFVVGLLARVGVVNWCYGLIESLFLRFPLVKTLYGAIKDLAGMFDGNKDKSQQTVLVDLSEQGLGLAIGFITNEQLPEAVTQAMSDERVAVYFPMSYNVGGYTTLIAKDRVKPVDWPFEEAMRFALTAGVSQVPQTKQ